MRKIFIGAFAALALAACAGSGTDPVQDAAPAPPPPEANAAIPESNVVAEGVAAPPPDAPLERGSDDVTVPGAAAVEPPPGDTRTVAQRRQDRARFDRCVSQAQNAVMNDPLGPSLESPEEICRRSLGQRDRNSAPVSR